MGIRYLDSSIWSLDVVSSSRQPKRRMGNERTEQSGELASNRLLLILLGLLVVIFSVFGYLDRINELIAVRTEIASLQSDLDRAVQHNAELEATRREVAGSTYVGETARSELGLIQPGDDPFIVLGEESPSIETQNGADTNAAALSQPETRAVNIFDMGWWRSFLGLP